MSIDWNMVITIIFSILPILSVLLIFLKKFFPVIDPYFHKGAVILHEVDDVLDGILLEYPDNKMLNTVNDVVDKLLSELTEAGYEVNDMDKNKIINHVKGRLKKGEGAIVKWEDGDLKLECSNKF
ncbi:MAG TPA: hypothetical protein VJ962_12635 [Clostridia bacterium]|nr:hypothetical protein [Clostridia bacterium]